MAVNILIGVGGTGAKTIEAALVLLLAGMSDDPVYVGIVDQDLANGNVARTVGLLARQHRFRQLWSSGENKIEWNQWAGSALGSNRVIPLFSGDSSGEPDSIYRPNAAGSSLAQMMGRGLSGPQKAMFDMLFMDDGDEQQMQLDEGYRGRAHVGSAAFISALSGDSNKFFDTIKAITESAQGQTVNVFFVGSAFGGTGAAGFPTLARRLYRLRKENKFGNAQNIRIGGMLMLPYFLFGTPEDDKEAAVTPDELLPKTQLALEYYHNLFKHEPCFDMFYRLGHDNPYPLGYHEPGSAEQSNPALPAELLSATAAIDFFRKMTANPDISETVIHMSARKDAVITWGDLPCDEPQQKEYQAKLGQLIRFCVYWKYFFFPELSKPIGGLLKRKNWAQKLADKQHPADAEELTMMLNEVVNRVLSWAATTEAMANRVAGGQNLWRMGAFLDPNHDGFANPKVPARLAVAIDDTYWADAFNGLIEKGDSGELGRGAQTIFDELDSATPHPKHSGIGKALVTVYDACRLA